MDYRLQVLYNMKHEQSLILICKIGASGDVLAVEFKPGLPPIPVTILVPKILNLTKLRREASYEKLRVPVQE